MSTLTIKDLPDSKELDLKAMLAIRGGFGMLSRSFSNAIDAIGNALETMARKQ